MTVHLLDGSSAEQNDITFDRESYHFLLKTGEGNVDITDLIDTPTKKFLFPDFDQNRDLLRVSNEQGVGATQGKVFDPETPTTTTGVLTQQTGSDWINNGINGTIDAGKSVVSSANEALQNLAKSAGISLGNSAVPILGILILTGFAVYFIYRKK